MASKANRQANMKDLKMASKANRQSNMKDLDPEQILRLRFRRKCRFRAIARLALANAYWLNEESEEYEGLEDVKKRVAQAMRGKTKKKPLLSLADKALLNKPAQDRTDKEKLYIYRIIGGLKCFKRYPNHVKKKLAAATYFKYYGPGRVIVKQHHSAHAMYFIVSGDLIVTHLIYDGLLNKDVPVEIGTLHAGNLFGEVSLLHNITRTATCTTIGHCELLTLLKEDFKSVLQVCIQASWDEVRCVMSYFSYFDGLDEVARREGCIMAQMKTYNVNDTILGDGIGVPNHVYFVLTGHCQMIESLRIISTTRLGRTTYTLHDPYVAEKEDSEENFFEKILNEPSSEKDSVKEQEGPKFPDSILKIKPVIDSTESSRSRTQTSLESKLQNSLGSQRVQTSIDDSVKDIKQAKLKNNSKAESDLHYSKTTQQSSVRTSDDKDYSNTGQIILPPFEHRRDSVRFNIDNVKERNFRTYFMQVCLYQPGSTFAFGENMRDRRIVALTHVQCMLLPKVWLLSRNTVNIWTRIRHFLDRKIPNKKQLFKTFVEERRWQEYRDHLVEDVVARSSSVNWTTVHDVPYSIRMEEMYDL